jgi:hypothetical protein
MILCIDDLVGPDVRAELLPAIAAAGFIDGWRTAGP